MLEKSRQTYGAAKPLDARWGSRYKGIFMFKNFIIIKIIISLFFLFADSQLVQANNHDSNEYSINNQVNELSSNYKIFQDIKYECSIEFVQLNDIFNDYKDYLFKIILNNKFKKNYLFKAVGFSEDRNLVTAIPYFNELISLSNLFNKSFLELEAYSFLPNQPFNALSVTFDLINLLIN